MKFRWRSVGHSRGTRKLKKALIYWGFLVVGSLEPAKQRSGII